MKTTEKPHVTECFQSLQHNNELPFISSLLAKYKY